MVGSDITYRLSGTLQTVDTWENVVGHLFLFEIERHDIKECLYSLQLQVSEILDPKSQHSRK